MSCAFCGELSKHCMGQRQGLWCLSLFAHMNLFAPIGASLDKSCSSLYSGSAQRRTAQHLVEAHEAV